MQKLGWYNHGDTAVLCQQLRSQHDKWKPCIRQSSRMKPGCTHQRGDALRHFDRQRRHVTAALDRVAASHREYPMALFKRAQVSVLLNEPDRAARIQLARRHADAITRPLIERERMFR